MLVKLPEHVSVNDGDKVRYTDGSMSVTLWFDTDNSIFTFEIIFDLLMKEMALLYSKKSPPRYVNIENSSLKIGRTTKKSMGTESFQASSSLRNLNELVCEQGICEVRT